MFNSLKTKIIIPVIISLALLVAVIITFVSISTTNLSATLSEERIRGAYQTAVAHLDNFKAYSRLAAYSVAISPSIVEFINTGNREEMLRYLSPRKQIIDIDSYVITDHLGYVILRTHAPCRYGDSGANFPGIAAALQGRSVTVYTPNPAMPMAMSSVVPVYDTEGRLIGTVVANIEMSTDKFVDDFAAIFNAEVTVFAGNTSVASTLFMPYEEGVRAVGIPISPDIAEAVIGRGEEVKLDLMILGVLPHTGVYFPLYGWEDEAVGIFFIGFSNEHALAATAFMQRMLVIIGVTSLVIAIVMMLFILVKFLKPLENLTENVSRINEIDAESVKIYGGERGDEIGDLSRTIQQMCDTLRVNAMLRKEMNEELQAALEKARAASQAKSNFLANMSHEIRTPLNVVVGLTRLLMDKDASVDDTQDCLQRVNTAGTTLTKIINNVLDISKIEAGKFELAPIQYEMASLLNDITTLSVASIDEKPIVFELQIIGKLFTELYGDDLRVKQILINLLNNAFKYTRTGNVTLGVSCERVGEKDVRLFFAVSDTGIGIRSEDLAKLFTDYNQVDTQANRMIEGTGLGLSIVKGLVELMDGNISVKSEYGKGSDFHVSIQQGFVSEKCIDAETAEDLRNFEYEKNEKKPASIIEWPDLNWAKVLVVDDLKTNLVVAKALLGKYKMEVDCVISGQDAVDKIKSGDKIYDAVFMDYMMPGMDGIEATRMIRAIDTEYTRALPVIALTADAVAGNEQRFKEKGFQAFVTKPINIMKLDAVVRRWIVAKTDKQAQTWADV